MSILFGILLTFLVFLIVVLIHELGHFATARLTGMKVLEFGFGIPPKLFRVFTDRRGTEYTFNALPIGGFVRIKWEDPMSMESLDPDAFSAKPWWSRVLVLVAGVGMNFLLAIVILFGFFYLGTAPIAPNFLTEKDYHSRLLPSPDAAIKSGYISATGIELTPLSGSIAERSWIRPGDLLISVDARVLDHVEDLMWEIKKNQELHMTLYGTGGARVVSLTPQNGKIGSYIGYRYLSVNKEFKLQYSFSDSLQNALSETFVLSYMTLDVLGKTLKDLILPNTQKDREIAEAMVAGPIGMGAWFISLVDLWVTWKMILMIIAMLSINLGVINILPFPALDGGRLVSTTIRSLLPQKMRNSSRGQKVETYIHTFGMILLLGFSLFIAILDISKLL